jgi:hypothetical protein
MKQFEVEITEIFKRTVSVKARNIGDARHKVKLEWRNKLHLLDRRDFVSVYFVPHDHRSYKAFKKPRF